MCQPDQCMQFKTWFLKKWVIKQTQVLRKSISGYLILQGIFTMELWKICHFVYEALESFWNFNISNVVYWWHHRYYTWDVVLHWHLPECWVANVLRQKFHLVASFLKNLSVTCLLICKLRYTCSHFDLQNWFLLGHEPFLAGLMLERNTPGPWKNDRCSTCDNEHWVFLVIIQHMIVYILVCCEWTTMRLT